MDLLKPFSGAMLAPIALAALTTSASLSATFHDLPGSADPSTNRIVVVFLSEGYTQGQLPKFVDDATAVFENLLAQPPFSEYRTLFHGHAIAVASPQNGSDHPAYGVTRSTYFNSAYDASDRLITIPLGPDGQGKVDELVNTFIPAANLKILLVNDPVSGGSDGFGYTVIASASSASMDMLVHETGHVLGGLGDEYEFGLPIASDVEQPNVTRETRRESIKWKAWIAPETPVPTPPTFDFMDVVGLFEGARYQPTGWYRPELDCKMRSLAVPFCDVCSEALVLGIYGLVRPVESYAPSIQSVAIETGGTASFSVQPILPATHTLQIRWLTNGVVAAENVTNLTVSSASLGVGSSTLTVEVKDPTPLVRTDPAGRLTRAISWAIMNGQVAPDLRLKEPLLSNGQLVFSVVGQPGRSYVLQHSANLLDWSSLHTNVLSPAGNWHTNQLSGFYRAQYLP